MYFPTSYCLLDSAIVGSYILDLPSSVKQASPLIHNNIETTPVTEIKEYVKLASRRQTCSRRRTNGWTNLGDLWTRLSWRQRGKQSALAHGPHFKVGNDCVDVVPEP